MTNDDAQHGATSNTSNSGQAAGNATVSNCSIGATAAIDATTVPASATAPATETAETAETPTITPTTPAAPATPAPAASPTPAASTPHDVAYFAGGCFWGLERYFQTVDGVVGTTVGYAQSTVPNPSYEQVCSGATDAAETVRVEFDPSRVSLRALALLFLEVIDPFSVDAQGPDHGRQYRTGMFYVDDGADAQDAQVRCGKGDARTSSIQGAGATSAHDERTQGAVASASPAAGFDASATANSIDVATAADTNATNTTATATGPGASPAASNAARLAASSVAAHATGNVQRDVYTSALEQLIDRDPRRPAVLVEPLRNFYPAEEHHQDYLVKNPGGYCHIPFAAIANVKRRQRYIERIWDLTLEQFAVTQRAATERPFVNAYDRTFEPGVYVDVVSGEPLFLSTDKFDAGCGWPAFSKPIRDDLLTEHEDDRVPGRPRIEVRTADTQIHLGHVFADGPTDRGGLRYCMNSAALRFVPLSRMAEEGYGDLIPRLQR